jgi:Uma2 family endonuclease
MNDPARKVDELNAPEVEAAWRATSSSEVAEIVDGELHVHPRPRSTHARAATRLARRLGPYDDDGDGPGGWILLIEPELHLGRRPDKLVPDLAGWRRARMPEMPDTAAFTLAPDWICEVLSSGTEPLNRGKKLRVYRREGVAHVWLLNPTLRTLEVYRLDAFEEKGGDEKRRYVLLETYDGSGTVRAEPFEAVELPLGTLWAR